MCFNNHFNYLGMGAQNMTYIITSPCVGLKDGACIDVCPVDCIYTTEDDNQIEL